VDPYDAEHLLRRTLTDRGVELTQRRAGATGAGDDATTAWDAFRSLATVPVVEQLADDGDLLFFDASLSPRLSDDDNPHIGAEEPEVFMLDFTRQFSFADEDGEDVGMNGITLTVEFPPSPDLERVVTRKQVMGRGGHDAQAWLAQVESSEAFRAAFGKHAATRFYFLQSDI
jgi:hypothetical protein